MANNSKTQAFTTSARPKAKRKNIKNKKRLRQQIVISIFAVIALILLMFATLIIGKIFTTQKNTNEDGSTGNDMITVPREESAVHMGNLLLINDNFKCDQFDTSNFVNVYNYKADSKNSEFTQINGKSTYALMSVNIYLSQTTLDAFNKMMIDYCNSNNLASSNTNNLSNIEITLGGFNASNMSEYQEYLDIGDDYYDHITGTAITIKTSSPSSVIKENSLKEQYNWIYQNAHKYGFIIRYPDGCAQHTQISANTRLHLRYVGIEHATYIYNNNICLEEYLELIRTKHTFSNPLSINSADGKTYVVYYVEYSGNPTSIPVMKDKNYTVSGDNMNGFIVTVEQ